ncbi:NADP-dependent phosphogluconate dehydrogenase, partial [Streptococcus anginosus]|nr:NADP-dependent phosphogluconate dehydrogenase [Streptococcus anginosus]
FERWNSTELDSYLIEITAEVLRQRDATTGAALVDVIADAAAQKGTGAWTVQNAAAFGVPATGIAEATFARSLSGDAAERAAGRAL